MKTDRQHNEFEIPARNARFRWKPILLSALVLPGTGQLYQRRWKTGTLVLVSFFGTAYYLMQQLTLLYQQMLTSLETQNLPADPDRLLQWVTDQAGQFSVAPGVQLAQWVILACWLFSIGDAWWYEKHKPDHVVPEQNGNNHGRIR